MTLINLLGEHTKYGGFYLTKHNQQSANNSGISKFRKGFVAPWHGFEFMCRQPRLWRYSVAPVLLNLVVTGLILELVMAAVLFAVTRFHPWCIESA